MRAVKTYSKSKQQLLTFSKRLTIIDIISWMVLTVILLAVIFFEQDAAEYCVKIETTITAAYVSLRLGYSAKAAVQNYKKISNSIDKFYDESDDDDDDDDQQDTDQDTDNNGNG